MPKRSVSAEIVTILAPGEAPLPQRRSGAAQDRAVQLVELLQELTGEGASLVELNFQKSIEARATATALRYGRKLAPSSNAAARMLKGVRK